MSPRFALSPSRIARFFFHDCERNLRFLATPGPRREVEGVPPPPHVQSPVTGAILEGGYAWEEDVVRNHLAGRVYTARGSGPLRDLAHKADDTVRVLGELRPEEAIYQATLVPPPAFLARYGLDPEIIEFRACRPDLVQRVDDHPGAPRLRVLDVKASEHMKASHRIQVALYALMLRDVLAAAELDLPVDLETGGVWLYGHARPEAFPLSLITGVLETFLRERLPRILEAKVADVPWHMFFRCEWCDYYAHCREEANATHSVSLLPYLSVGGRSYLREAPWGGEPVRTLEELRALLAAPEGHDALDACGSLRGHGERLQRMAEALTDKTPRPHGGSTVAMPIYESVRLVLTLQSEPFSGRTYACGFRRTMGKEVYGNGAREAVFVAERLEECSTIRRAFLEALHAELRTLHQYNQGRSWREQRSLQAYVFDGYEQQLFDELLLGALDDPDLAPVALDLFFHFQDTALAAADQHPSVEVPYPIVVLTRVLREVIALPSPIALRLSDVHRALPNPSFPYEYRPSRYLNFDLSNPLKSDAIFRAWNDARPDGIEMIRRELGARLIATGCVVDGLRSRIQERLFAWAPKFALPGRRSFRHPELSRLSFVVGYECFMGALATREARAKPWSERIRDATSVPLRYLGGEVWMPEGQLPASALEPSGGFPQHLLVPEGGDGERAQMAYDDHRFRRAPFAPRGSVRLAAVMSVTTDRAKGLIRAVELSLRTNREQPAFVKGDRAVLHPRFTDYTSDRVLKRLQELDEGGSAFLTLLRDPGAFAQPVYEPRAVHRALVPDSADDLTASQTSAFEHLTSNRLTLVWGPPGTGKTYFIAKALLRLAWARGGAGLGLRVAVAAFTHAAIENLLREILDIGQRDVSVPVYKLGHVVTPRGAGIELLEPSQVASSRAPLAVFGGTVYALHKAAEAGAAPFDVLVVDEASQMKLGELALATSVLGPMGRVLLAGDDLQLPPIIQGAYPEPLDGLPGLESSVFAYLRARDRGASPFTRQLLECWRMNRTLCGFAAATLYGSAFRPATPEVASRRIALAPARGKAKSAIVPWLLDPAFPLVVCILEDVRASVENPVEAGLVAALSGELRARLLDPKTKRTYPSSAEGDQRFRREGLFIVSPHHAQIRAIKGALAEVRAWESEPFVDTVDKMQGQECQAVIVSYGVADGETALREATFIYSRNRLNVSVTRARSKCVVFLPRPLLEPSFDLLSAEDAALGLAHMHELLAFCRRHGEERSFEVGSAGRMTAIRAAMSP